MKAMTGRPGRPREFDIEDATRDAMEVFWQNGFHATSLPDLIEGMGLTRGSIYKAYEDKRSIYLAALETFIEVRLKRLEKILSKPDKRSAISELLRMTARDTASTIGRKGCFSTAATIEMVAIDEEVERQVSRFFASMESMLTNAVESGQENGTITSSLSSASIARFIICTIEGMAVLGKLGPTQRNNQKVINVAMTILD